MKILVTGACGFVGSTLALNLKSFASNVEIIGLDSLVRPGSELNRSRLRKQGIQVLHGDLRVSSDLEALPNVDWVIDAAANPSILAGTEKGSSSKSILEHNLIGTVHLLEFCKRVQSGLILISTSRVYAIEPLSRLDFEINDSAFAPAPSQIFPEGVGISGIKESFSTEPPLSLYGVTKLASEKLALEYGRCFDFPVWINRCGVMAGAGQFGRADQGIFSFWIHSWAARRPLSYIGFDGKGYQTRDCLHPKDLVPLLHAQMRSPGKTVSNVLNVSGGPDNTMSLAQLSRWCEKRFGKHTVSPDPTPRIFDLPWVVLDPSLALADWQWKPQTPLQAILEEIARHAESNPAWLDQTN